MQKFSVKTEFMKSSDGLVKIMTTLSQDDRTLELEQDNNGYLDSLAQKLDSNMSMAISTYKLRRWDNLRDSTCGSSGSTLSTMTSISNFRWSMNQEA